MHLTDAQRRYEAMYRQTYPTVLRYCQRRLPPDAARDVVSDVFLVAWRRFADVPEPALPWLIRTAHLTVRTAGRSGNRQVRLVARVAAVDPPADAPDHADAVARTHLVGQILALLSEQDRELLMLTSWDDLDAATVAHVVGCSQPAVRVRIYRARRRLAALLDQGSAPAAPPQPPSRAHREELA